MSAGSHRRLFLSCVSGEFRSYRELLVRYLRRPNLEVKVQEDFIVSPSTTLEKDDEYIRGCDAVIHLIGDATGFIPEPPAVDALRRRYPDLVGRLPFLGPLLDEANPGISYTQWEAALSGTLPLGLKPGDE
ncbi:MAG: DUF4062 domain-containing protein [Isosphaeraceae bacterium]